MFKTKIKNRTSRFCSTSCVSRDATARSRCSVISATSSAREHVAGTSRTIRAFAIHSRYAALSSPAATRLGASGLRARVRDGGGTGLALCVAFHACKALALLRHSGLQARVQRRPRGPYREQSWPNPGKLRCLVSTVSYRVVP